MGVGWGVHGVDCSVQGVGERFGVQGGVFSRVMCLNLNGLNRLNPNLVSKSYATRVAPERRTAARAPKP